jgi:hypothetical protein
MFGQRHSHGPGPALAVAAVNDLVMKKNLFRFFFLKKKI